MSCTNASCAPPLGVIVGALLLASCAAPRSLDLPQPTHGREALEYRLLTLRGNDDSFDPHDLLRAQRQQQQLASQTASLVAGISPATWTSRGPTNAGGRTRAFAVHPLNPQILWAGAASGGLWKSTNGGASWRAIDDFLPALTIYSLAIDPTNPDVLYAGTGEVTPGVGIYKSTDGGESWALLPSTLTNDFAFVRRIAIDPSQPQTLLAAVFHDFRGVQRSVNGGVSWQQVLPAAGASQVAFDPADSRRAIASVLEFTPANGFHWTVHWSPNNGATWFQSTGLPITDPFQRIELAYAPSDSDIVYAQLASSPPQIFRSTDGGRTFSLRSTVNNIVVDYMNSVWVSPTDPDLLIVAGVNAFRSTNGGATFTGPINGGCLDQSLDAIGHVDIHGFHAHPGYNGAGNRTVWMTTDGGIYRTGDIRSADCSQGWTALNTGYQTTQFYSAAASPAGMVIGGTQDQGSLRVLPGSSTAFKYAGGDGGVVAIDPTDDRFLYGSSQFLLQLFRSSDRGNSLEIITTGLDDMGDPATVNFIAPMLLDPLDPTTLYAGGISLWRARNVRGGPPPLWQPIRPAGSERIYHFSIAETNPDVLWLGQNDGKIYRTQNARATNPQWLAVEDNGALDQLPNRVPARVQVSRHDPNTVYVTFGGFEHDNLWRTRNGGATWTNLTGSLPSVPMEAFAEHPVFPDWLYVGTTVGLFTSTDGGSSWTTQNGAPANVVVRDLQFVPDTTQLTMGTFGRGFHLAETPGDDCTGGDGLCLAASRFDVRITWRDSAGQRGTGTAGALTADTGTFWFFNDSNIEVIVKVLDGCAINDRFWVFAGGLTDVATSIEVTDTLTGTTRRYSNPLGELFQPIQDTSAFATCGGTAASEFAERRLASLHDRALAQPSAQRSRPHPATAESAPSSSAPGTAGTCQPDARTLCLADGRFSVVARFSDGSGAPFAQGVEISSDTGYMWFFSPDNVELLVKVLDGCAITNSFWVFAGGLTDVAVSLFVTDTQTGTQQIYRNPSGTPFQPIQDVESFGVCS